MSLALDVASAPSLRAALPTVLLVLFAAAGLGCSAPDTGSAPDGGDAGPPAVAAPADDGGTTDGGTTDGGSTDGGTPDGGPGGPPAPQSPFHRAFVIEKKVDPSGLDNFVAAGRLLYQTGSSGTNLIAPATVWAQVQQHPEGQRAIFTLDAHLLLRSDGAGGVVKTYYDLLPSGMPAPWFDEWRSSARAVLEDWFAAYAAAGGALDVFLLDFESGLTHYLIVRSGSATDPALVGPTRLAQWISEVQADPRWPALRAELETAAAEAGYGSSLQFADLSDFGSWNSADALKPKQWVWNAVMHRRIGEVLQHITFDVIWTHFPHCRGSNYNHRYYDGAYVADPLNSTRQSPASRGMHVGTGQSKSFYGTRTDATVTFPTLASWSPPMAPVGSDAGPGANEYYNLIWYVRVMRGMAATAPQVPIQPWISGNAYALNRWLPAGGATGTDWYAEAMFHLAMHGARDFFVWGPFTKTSTGESDGAGERLIADALHELDALVGYEVRAPLVLSTTSWSDPYLLSGVHAGGREIYRFTPPAGGKVVSASPFRFELSSGQVVEPVEGAALLEAGATTSSRVGHWLVR